MVLVQIWGSVSSSLLRKSHSREAFMSGAAKLREEERSHKKLLPVLAGTGFFFFFF